MKESTSALRFIIAGQIQRDFILPMEGKPVLDKPGGSLLYSAIGFSLWENDAGLISRIGEDYPQDWIYQIARQGFDTRGIVVITDNLDVRRFIAYPEADSGTMNNPISHFARLNLEFPKTLLGYNPPHQKDNRTEASAYSIQLNEIPHDYFDVIAAHLCPIDYISHHLLPSALKHGHVTTITIDPSPGYMNPTFWNDVNIMVKDITAFLPSEKKIRTLFQGRSVDLWEMAEAIGSKGCEFVVIKRGAQGQYLYDHLNGNRWIIPAYPARVKDPTGAGDAFCGGFLAGYHKTYDPLQAILYGSVSASLTVEGSGPYFPLESLPGLAEARLEAMKEAPFKL